MSGRVHQEDEDKLKATVKQKEKDRTITGTVVTDGRGFVQPISATALPLPEGAATSAKQLADGHNVTVDNAVGAAAVPIKDGGNTITVDGTVTAEQATAASLKATVTQAEKDRTITSGTVTTNKGEPAYTKVKKTGFYPMGASDSILWDPAEGKKFVITDIIVSADVAMRVYLEDGATKIWQWYFAAKGGCVINLQTPDESSTADNNLTITTSITGECSIKVLGYEV